MKIVKHFSRPKQRFAFRKLFSPHSLLQGILARAFFKFFCRWPTMLEDVFTQPPTVKKLPQVLYKASNKIQITLDYYFINICKTMFLQIEFEVALQTGNLSFLCYDDYKTLLSTFSHTQLSTTMSAGIVQELQVHALYISSERC